MSLKTLKRELRAERKEKKKIHTVKKETKALRVQLTSIYFRVVWQIFTLNT